MNKTRPLVLCVDDDQRTLDVVSRLVSRLPVERMAVNHPRWALEAARERVPDLLVLDLMMPEISGWELLNLIRQEPGAARMRVIVLSAKDDAIERTIARNIARVDVFMGKPFDTDELTDAITRLLMLPQPVEQ